MFVPHAPGAFAVTLQSHGTTRPGSAFGATVTPGNNTMGSWASVMSATSDEAFAILININNVAVSASAKDCLVDIGIDPDGGSSYTVLAPTLLASCAAPYNAGSGGIWYYFPVRVTAGATIAARAQVNNATVGTARVNITLYCKPRVPEAVKYGTKIEAIGITAGTSTGTAITLGTTSDGAWTSIGSTSASNPPAFFFQVGFGTNDTTMAAAAVHLDLASDSAGSRVIAADIYFSVTSTEQINSLKVLDAVASPGIAPGTTMYVRGQSSNTADTGTAVAVYAVS